MIVTRWTPYFDKVMEAATRVQFNLAGGLSSAVGTAKSRVKSLLVTILGRARNRTARDAHSKAILDGYTPVSPVQEAGVVRQVRELLGITPKTYRASRQLETLPSNYGEPK